MVTCRHCLVVKATLQAEGSCLHWNGFTWNNIDVIPSFSWNNIVAIVLSGLIFGLEHFPLMPFFQFLILSWEYKPQNVFSSVSSGWRTEQTAFHTAHMCAAPASHAPAMMILMTIFVRRGSDQKSEHCDACLKCIHEDYHYTDFMPMRVERVKWWWGYM